MIVIGFLLAAAAAVFGLDLLWKNRFKVTDPTVFSNSLGISSVRWLFLVGVIVGAAIVFGVALLLAGLGRKRTKSVAARKTKRESLHAEKQRDTLQADNDHLRRQVDQQRVTIAHPATTTTTSIPPSPGATIPQGHHESD
jgi:hypothetical protein